MQKLIKLIKKKYKIILASLMVIILALILIGLGLKGKKEITDYTIENQSMYQYLDTNKITYDTKMTISNSEGVTKLEIDDQEQVIDATPLYYTGEDKVLFPSNMAVIFPLNNNSQKRVPNYTILDGESSLYKTLKYKKESYDLEHAFLYDGNDLYFFIEPTTLIIDEKTIELQALSYVIYNNLTNYCTYYNYNVTSEILNVKNDVQIKTNNYTINLKIDGIKSGDDYKLLAKNLEILNSLF